MRPVRNLPSAAQRRFVEVNLVPAPVFRRPRLLSPCMFPSIVSRLTEKHAADQSADSRAAGDVR